MMLRPVSLSLALEASVRPGLPVSQTQDQWSLAACRPWFYHTCHTTSVCDAVILRLDSSRLKILQRILSLRHRQRESARVQPLFVQPCTPYMNLKKEHLQALPCSVVDMLRHEHLVPWPAAPLPTPPGPAIRHVCRDRMVKHRWCSSGA